MSKFVKFLKTLWKVGIRIGLVILVIYLVFSNISLKKENKKLKNTIKTYENESESEKQEQVPEVETDESTDETEFSTEELNLLNRKINILEKRIETLEKEKNSTTVKSESATEVEEEENLKAYLLRKYPFDGNFYKEAGETQYYSDTFCTQKLKAENLRFMSPATDYTNAENGLSITCLLTEDWQIVYCTQSPYLVTESEYEEIHYQK